MAKQITDSELFEAIATDPFHRGLVESERAKERLSVADLLAMDDAEIEAEIEECLSEPPHGEPVDDDWNEDTTEVPTKVWCRPVDMKQGEIVEMGDHEAAWFAGLSPMEAAWFTATIISTKPDSELAGHVYRDVICRY